MFSRFFRGFVTGIARLINRLVIGDPRNPYERVAFDALYATGRTYRDSQLGAR